MSNSTFFSNFSDSVVLAAKEVAINLLVEAGCVETNIPTKLFFRLMEGEQSVVKSLWLDCLYQAAPIFLEEGFGKEVQVEGASSIECVDWKRIPSSLFMYVVFGIDSLLTNEKGETVGVITTLPGVEEDLTELSHLRPLLDFLGVDAIVHVELNLGQISTKDFNATKSLLVEDLKDMVTDLQGWVNEIVVEAQAVEVEEVQVVSLDTPTVTSSPTVTSMPTASIVLPDAATETFVKVSTFDQTATFGKVSTADQTISFIQPNDIGSTQTV